MAKGMYSVQYQLDSPVPERMAVLVNSRSRKLKMIERMVRASMPSRRSIAAILESPDSINCRTSKANMTMIRKSGMTSRLSLTNINTRSVEPPCIGNHANQDGDHPRDNDAMREIIRNCARKRWPARRCLPVRIGAKQVLGRRLRSFGTTSTKVRGHAAKRWTGRPGSG